MICHMYNIYIAKTISTYSAIESNVLSFPSGPVAQVICREPTRTSRTFSSTPTALGKLGQYLWRCHKIRWLTYHTMTNMEQLLVL